MVRALPFRGSLTPDDPACTPRVRTTPPEAGQPRLNQPAGPILVATDFSEGSAAAVREARSLAAALDAEVVVVHVSGAALWQPDPAVAAWLARVGVDAGSMTLRFGVPWAQIVRFALEVGACMVAVGSHGRSGFHPLAPGSTAAQLLTRCPVPVLVVAERGRAATAEGGEPHDP